MNVSPWSLLFAATKNDVATKIRCLNQSKDEYENILINEDHTVNFENDYAGLNRENLQGNIVFKFKNFVEGQARAEVIIDNELYRAKIFHEYEKKYKGLDGKYYYPDFYIPEYNLYIEYFGMNENKQKILNIFNKNII